MEADLLYCFRCGRRLVKSQLQNRCMYCSAATQRVIRPPKRCRFCDEPVRHKAIKCHHCGEFIDGRDHVDPAAKAGGPTFVIEQAIIQNNPQGMQIEAGPGRALDAPAATDRALDPPPAEQAAPQALPEPQCALPAPGSAQDRSTAGAQQDAGRDAIRDTPGDAPDDSSVISVDAEAVGAETLPSGSGTPAPAVRPEAAEDDDDALLPVPALRDAAPAIARQSGKAVAAAAGLMRRVIDKRRDTSGNAITAIDVEDESEEDRYRICAVCQTEILADDSFCYHCGQKYFSSDWEPRAKAGARNVVLYVLVVLCLVAHAAATRALEVDRPELIGPVTIGSAVLAFVFGFAAFARARDVAARVVSIAVIVATLIAVLKF